VGVKKKGKADLLGGSKGPEKEKEEVPDLFPAECHWGNPRGEKGGRVRTRGGGRQSSREKEKEGGF